MSAPSERRLLVLILLLFFVTTDYSYGQQCNLSGRNVVYSYAPALCNQESCKHFQKLTFVRDKILVYFKKNIGTNSDDVDFGFEYTIGQTIDVLSDQLQRPGLNHAIGQLPPGARYSKYFIAASRASNTINLNDGVEYLLPNVGTFVFNTATSITIYNCSSCAITSLNIRYSLNGQSQPPITVGLKSCRIE